MTDTHPQEFWLASYPRSGNGFVQLALQHAFGYGGQSVYSTTGKRLKFGKLLRPDAYDDAKPSYVKTHELPRTGDTRSALLIVRDGRDALVSYSRLIVKTEPDNPLSKLSAPERLNALIRADNIFGGWSGSVSAWMSYPNTKAIVRFEDLLADPVTGLAVALGKLGLDSAIRDSSPMASFESVRAVRPQYAGVHGAPGAWRHEMPAASLALFLSLHGHMLNPLGYAKE